MPCTVPPAGRLAGPRAHRKPHPAHMAAEPPAGGADTPGARGLRAPSGAGTGGRSPELLTAAPAERTPGRHGSPERLALVAEVALTHSAPLPSHLGAPARLGTGAHAHAGGGEPGSQAGPRAPCGSARRKAHGAGPPPRAVWSLRRSGRRSSGEAGVSVPTVSGSQAADGTRVITTHPTPHTRGARGLRAAGSDGGGAGDTAGEGAGRRSPARQRADPSVRTEPR